jgi:hypothetical protein
MDKQEAAPRADGVVRSSFECYASFAMRDGRASSPDSREFAKPGEFEPAPGGDGVFRLVGTHVIGTEIHLVFACRMVRL